MDLCKERQRQFEKSLKKLEEDIFNSQSQGRLLQLELTENFRNLECSSSVLVLNYFNGASLIIRQFLSKIEKVYCKSLKMTIAVFSVVGHLLQQDANPFKLFYREVKKHTKFLSYLEEGYFELTKLAPLVTDSFLEVVAPNFFKASSILGITTHNLEEIPCFNIRADPTSGLHRVLPRSGDVTENSSEDLVLPAVPTTPLKSSSGDVFLPTMPTAPLKGSSEDVFLPPVPTTPLKGSSEDVFLPPVPTASLKSSSPGEEMVQVRKNRRKQILIPKDDYLSDITIITSTPVAPRRQKIKNLKRSFKGKAKPRLFTAEEILLNCTEMPYYWPCILKAVNVNDSKTLKHAMLIAAHAMQLQSMQTTETAEVRNLRLDGA